MHRGETPAMPGALEATAPLIFRSAQRGSGMRLGLDAAQGTVVQTDGGMCQSFAVTRIVRAKLEGPDARLGDVPAADVARLIIGLERALARAAYVALGTSRGAQSGRHRAAIERASRLRLVGVESGSVIELLALPDLGELSEGELPLSVLDLSSAAFAEVIRAIGTGDGDVDAELASALARLGDELGVGERNDHLSLAMAGEDSRVEPPDAVRLDAAVRQRMRILAASPDRSLDDTVVGTLVEADFEKSTARLQPPFGTAIVVAFPEEMADDIYRALRRPAQLQGRVRFNPRTSIAREIELHRVSRADQLELDSGAFFTERTVAELAAAQGIAGPVLNPMELSDPDLSDTERAAFLAPLIQA